MEDFQKLSKAFKVNVGELQRELHYVKPFAVKLYVTLQDNKAAWKEVAGVHAWPS